MRWDDSLGEIFQPSRHHREVEGYKTRRWWLGFWRQRPRTLLLSHETRHLESCWKQYTHTRTHTRVKITVYGFSKGAGRDMEINVGWRAQWTWACTFPFWEQNVKSSLSGNEATTRSQVQSLCISRLRAELHGLSNLLRCSRVSV